MKNSFKAGDVVSLQSCNFNGGKNSVPEPFLTVLSVERDNITCVYYSPVKGEFVEQIFSKDVLELVFASKGSL
jgi:hypothetical protein